MELRDQIEAIIEDGVRQALPWRAIAEEVLTLVREANDGA